MRLYHFPRTEFLLFPGAVGGGKCTSVGNGVKVLFAVNHSVKGNASLHEAIDNYGARTIFYNISGNITLQKPFYIKDNRITIEKK